MLEVNHLPEQESTNNTPDISDQDINEQFQKSQETIKQNRRYEQIEQALEEQLWVDLSVDKPQTTFGPMHETIGIYNEQTGEHIADIAKQIDMLSKEWINIWNIDNNYIYIDWAPSNMEGLKNKISSMEQDQIVENNNTNQDSIETGTNPYLEKLTSWDYTATEFFEGDKGLYDYMWENMDATDSDGNYIVTDSMYDTFKQRISEYITSNTNWELKNDIKVRFSGYGEFSVENKYFTKRPEWLEMGALTLPFWWIEQVVQEEKVKEPNVQQVNYVPENRFQNTWRFQNRWRFNDWWNINWWKVNSQPETFKSKKEIVIADIVEVSEWVGHDPENRYDTESENIIKDIIDNNISYKELVDAWILHSINFSMIT